MGSDAPPTLKVTRLNPPSLVVSAQAVEENNGTLYLSNLDQNIAVIVETLYFFQARPKNPPLPASQNDQHRGIAGTENGQSTNGNATATEGHSDPARLLKEALAKVLVYYYPLTGRLGISQEGKLEVKLTREGVLFVEAEANLSLSELAYDVNKLDPQVSTQLVYHVPGATSILQIPPVVVQVTKFKCGGWALGLGNNHCMFDGIGAMEFINSWAELARGEKYLSLSPVLDRSILRPRSPLQISFPHYEFAEIEDLSKDKNMLHQDEGLVHATFPFTPEDLAALKKAALAGFSASPPPRVTTFESLAAHIWRARTRALAMEPAQKFKLLFAVDGRNRLNPPLPEGYIGNGVALAWAIATSSDLTEQPLSYAVGLVQDAINMITGDYIRSAIDFFELTRARPALVATLVLTTWSRLTFHTTDFGWGEPVYSGPATLPEREAVLLLSHGSDRKSINIVISLPPTAMDKFKKEVRSF